jgi:predicted RNA-binding protein with PUA-like domain
VASTNRHYNVAMNYFLAKTEPSTYSIDDLERDKQTVWDGVHNFQAIAVIRSMHPGDRVLIYHSQTDKAIVGLAEVTTEPYPNTADPRTSWVVGLRYIEKYTRTLTLAEVKGEPLCADFLLVRHSRLSVMAVPEPSLDWILSRLS